MSELGNPASRHSVRPWISIIIPAHNEGRYLGRCLEAFASQSRTPDELLVVNDNSTDTTQEIAEYYASNFPWIRCVNYESEPGHHPGGKVIRAFNFGLTKISPNYNYLGKFDADVVLPPNYFEGMLHQFSRQPNLGMCSGLVYIQKGNRWIYEPIADTNHIRGPIKLYRRSCFEAIGGLVEAIGWDTADVLLARYCGFEVGTVKELRVQHLRPTGTAYAKENALKQGQVLYTLRYGLILGLLASIKMAWKRRSFLLPFHHLRGYLRARSTKSPFLLSADAAKFARRWRWQQILKKLF